MRKRSLAPVNILEFSSGCKFWKVFLWLAKFEIALLIFVAYELTVEILKGEGVGALESVDAKITFFELLFIGRGVELLKLHYI